MLRRLPSLSALIVLSLACEGYDSRATGGPAGAGVGAGIDPGASSTAIVTMHQPDLGSATEGTRSQALGDQSPRPIDVSTASDPSATHQKYDTSRVFRVRLASTTADREPNELGRIPILEYHLIGENEARWERRHDRFRADLELLHRRGYRPITLAELADRRIDLPAGLSPVVVTFDDASPGQFRYIEREDGVLEIDPRSAVGIWLDFHREHPDWEKKAVFCLLSGAEAGRSFFGDKGIEGQKTEWRHLKLRLLVEQGFELCSHTLWHANLARGDDAFVQEQIARGVMAIDSAVPGHRVRSFALPLGMWPKNRELARAGEWTERRKGGDRIVRYAFDVVLEVAGGPARSPWDPLFDAGRLPRVQVFGEELERVLDLLDRNGLRYVSDGDSTRVTARRLATPGGGPDGSSASGVPRLLEADCSARARSSNSLTIERASGHIVRKRCPESAL